MAKTKDGRISDWFSLSLDINSRHEAILEEAKRLRDDLTALRQDPSMSPREKLTLARIDKHWGKIEAMMRMDAKAILTTDEKPSHS